MMCEPDQETRPRHGVSWQEAAAGVLSTVLGRANYGGLTRRSGLANFRSILRRSECYQHFKTSIRYTRCWGNCTCNIALEPQPALAGVQLARPPALKLVI